MPGPTTAAGRTTTTSSPGCTRRASRRALHLEQVADDPVGHGAQRRVLGQRQVVVRQRAVDHRAGHEHDALDARRSGRGDRGLRAAHVERRPRRAGTASSDQSTARWTSTSTPASRLTSDRVADVDHAPGDARRTSPRRASIASTLPTSAGVDERTQQHGADRARGTGDGDRAAASGASGNSSRPFADGVGPVPGAAVTGLPLVVTVVGMNASPTPILPQRAPAGAAR